MEQYTVDLPVWIKEPVELALGDLQDPGAQDLILEWKSESDDAGTLTVGEPVNAVRRFEDDGLVPANLVVAVADWLQAQLFIDPTAVKTGALPVCPGHDHTMRAKSLYDVAWWFCRTTDTPVRLVGEN